MPLDATFAMPLIATFAMPLDTTFALPRLLAVALDPLTVLPPSVPPDGARHRTLNSSHWRLPCPQLAHFSPQLSL